MVFEIPIENIYKIHDTNSKNLYIFGGKYTNKSDLKRIFSNSVYSKLKEENTNFIFSEHLIYKTDSINAIKNKLLLTIQRTKGTAYDDLNSSNIYLFSSTSKKVDIEKIFSEKKKNPDTTEVHDDNQFDVSTLLRLVSNVVGLSSNDIIHQNNYSFEDVIRILKYEKDKETITYIPLGMSKHQYEDPLFVVNPSLNNMKSVIISDILPPLNNNYNVLLEYLPLHDNEIFVSFEKDVSNSSNYFPKYKNDIVPISKFTTQDMFHNMYYSKLSLLPYDTIGIESFEISLLNNGKNSKKFIPLGAIFKNVHATENMLLINYNPGLHKENIVRLYSNSLSKNGKIIPVMSKKEIDRVYAKMSVKSNSISAYIIIDEIELFVEYVKEGIIKVNSENKKSPMTAIDWDNVLKKGINPFINQINAFLGSSGYHFNEFVSLRNEKIETLKYVLSINVSDNISIMKQFPCLTHIFDVYNDNVSNKQNIDMRFKEVSHFNSNDAQILLIQNNEDEHIQLQSLMMNYNMNEKDASERLNKYLMYETERSSNNLESNYGLLITMRLVENKLSVEANNITSIDYLYDLHVYIDCILRLTQKNYLKTFEFDISNLCTKKSDNNVDDDTKNDDDTDDDTNDDANYDNFDFGDDNVDLDFDNFDKDNDNDISEANFDNFVTDTEVIDNELVKDGTSLNEYFLKKLKHGDQNLFGYDSKDGYLSYSRLCESNVDRQPVIITDEEKKKIDTEHPGSYSHALRHGSDEDPKNHNWFICPRYWCLKTNSSLTQKEVEDGVCGKVIPKNAKVIPKGHYVYEFDSGKDNHHAKDKLVDGKILKGEYIHNGPGFLKAKNPNEQCLPCCFKMWNSKSQIEKNKECKGNNLTDDKTLDNKYVSGFQTTPIDKGRWGFLPISVQKFLNTNQEEAQSKKNPAYILPNKQCLLRYGVEKSSNRSFIACISDIYSYKQGGKVSPPSIDEMQLILSKTITLDMFIQFHNGSLVKTFQPKKTDLNFKDCLKTFKDSHFVKSLNIDDKIHQEFLVDTVSSFENYKKFLLEKTELIDHTYLWDHVTNKNPLLMKNGFNLVILEIINNDITDNISLICPSNSHNSLYESSRETIILLKNGVFYEPIYQYEEKNYVLQVRKSFIETNSSINMIKTLNTINRYQKEYCSPNPSRSVHVYNFKRNLHSFEIAQILYKIDYSVKYQVSNYQSKCIGVYAYPNNEKNKGIFIPCFPSEISKEIPITFMDNEKMWHSYNETIERLSNVNDKSNSLIVCKPSLIVQEDLLVVGILTETNQFVQLSKPEMVTSRTMLLPVVNKYNYNVIDKVITTSKKEDSKRIDVIRRISLEQQFYLAFRTIGRLHLNDYENLNFKNELISLLKTNSSYKTKMLQCIKILHILLNKYITFDVMNDDFLNSYANVMNCEEPKHCLLKNNGNVLVIPAMNLVSNLDNDKLYFGKLSDEIIRNRRTRLFLLNPDYFVTVPRTQYKVRTNELLIVQSLLTDDFFSNMKRFTTNSYIHKITYDTAEPLFNKDILPYSNKVFLEDNGWNEAKHRDKLEEEKVEEKSGEEILEKSEEILLEKSGEIAGDKINKEESKEKSGKKSEESTEDSCVKEILTVKGNTIAKWRFGNTSKEMHFKDNLECGFSLLLRIMSEKGIEINGDKVNFIKDKLCDGYRKHYETHGNNILSILKKQGKIQLINKISKGNLSLDEIIMSSDYYLSDIDIWILSIELNLPIVLFSSTKLKNMNNLDWLYLSPNKNDFHDTLYFVRAPSKVESNSPIPYSLIIPSMRYNDLRGDMKDTFKSSNTNGPNFQSIETRLKIITIKKAE